MSDPDPWGDAVDEKSSSKIIIPVHKSEEQKHEPSPHGVHDDPWEEVKEADAPDWTLTNYDSTAQRGERRPRGRGDGRRGDRGRGGDSTRSYRGDSGRGDYAGRGDYSGRGREDSGYRGQSEEYRGYRGRDDRRIRGRFPRGERGEDRGGIESSRGRGGKYTGERTKIKRHRLFENNHDQQVIFREDEQQIDPENYSVHSNFRSNRNWDELNIPQNILAAIEEIGYIYPSKIQSFGIDVILQEGFENLIAQAPNGSGKTATFIIGSLCRVDLSDPSLQVICLSHTIELSNQIFEEYQKITSRIGATISMISKDSKPTGPSQVIVTVAGSFMKAIRTKSISLANLKVFVVDEADHLFDTRSSQEFYNGLSHLIAKKEIPSNVQFLLFSATFSDQIKTDIVNLLKGMNEIAIKKEELMLDLIKHFYIRCDQREKIMKFETVLKRINKGITIAFVNTCDFARLVCQRTQAMGHRTALLMGRDMSIDERNLTMQDFRSGKYTVLVTTNLLARGIDNTKVSCVINFDLPRVIGKGREMDYVLYLHRSGRCSRFGRNGLCFNIITSDQELEELKTIEEYYSITINELVELEEIEKMLEENYTASAI